MYKQNQIIPYRYAPRKKPIVCIIEVAWCVGDNQYNHNNNKKINCVYLIDKQINFYDFNQALDLISMLKDINSIQYIYAHLQGPKVVLIYYITHQR